MNMKRLFILLAALTAVLSCGEEAEELNEEVQLLCVTVNASDITRVSALRTGECSIKNSKASTGNAYCYYSKTASDAGVLKASGIRLNAGQVDKDGGEFSVTVTGLEDATTYYYMASVAIDDKEAFGKVKSFTTNEVIKEGDKWYGYNSADNKNDVALVLELKADNSADFIITAWGDRWQGAYTYDGETVKLTWTKFLSRPAAVPLSEQGIDPCAPENIYKYWVEVSAGSEDYANAGMFGDVISIGFTHTGDTGTLNIANRDFPAERQ